MSENVPLIGVGRLVSNITSEQITALKSGLMEGADDPSTMRGTLQRMFEPMNRLRAPIIPRYEFMALQRRLGTEMLDEEGVADLAECLEDELIGSIETREVAALPVHIHRAGNGSKYALAVGESVGMVRERVLARQVIGDFVGQHLPRGMWLSNDAKITQIVLASSETAKEADLLSRLGPVIEKEVSSPEKSSFPASILLGQVGVQRSTRPL
jgi:hypothetical protein